jgi:hypothetical protein
VRKNAGKTTGDTGSSVIHARYIGDRGSRVLLQVTDDCHQCPTADILFVVISAAIWIGRIDRIPRFSGEITGYGE